MFEDIQKGHTGLWVGFWLPRPIAEQLAVEGGEKPEDMHLTLAYVPGAGGGMDADNKQKVLDALSDFAGRYNPMTGVVGGLGRFFASGTSDGKDVIYSSFDAPELPDFRQDLVRCLEGVGFPPSRAHGYTPHITLAYVDPDMDAVFAHGESVNVTFPWLHVRFGETTSHTFPLLGLGAFFKSGSPPEGDDWQADVQIAKLNDDQRLVFGWLSVSEEEDGTLVIDHHDDIIEPDELERMAYDFVLYARKAGEMHERWDGIGRLVESMVFTREKQKALGIPDGTLPIGWWVGFKIDEPEVWAKVKSGEYDAFSIGGKAIREEVTM